MLLTNNNELYAVEMLYYTSYLKIKSVRFMMTIILWDIRVKVHKQQLELAEV